MRVLFAAIATLVAAVNASIMTVDLGSEFLKVGMVARGKPMEIVENIAAKRKSESVVAFDKDGVRHFANTALKLSTRFPGSTFRFLTTLIGQQYNSTAARIYQERFPQHKLVADARGLVQIEDSEGEIHHIEEYLAMMLQYCVDITTRFSEEPVSSAIVAVPPFFSQAERNAVLAAAKLINLRVSQIMNTDMAAALQYGSFRAEEFKEKGQKIVIYDMGSTSTTATVFQYRWLKNKDLGRQLPTIEVLANAYNRNLGGFDFDLAMRDLLIERWQEVQGVKEDITKNPRAMARLLIEAAKVKIVLSANKQTQCYIENLAENKDFKTVVTRDEFLQRTESLLSAASAPLINALDEFKSSGKLALSDISAFIVIGGGSRIPRIQELLSEALGGRPLDFNLNGDESVTLGAAYRAAESSPSVRVPQKWSVKTGVMFPIHVAFVRPEHTDPDGTVQPEKLVTKELFKRMGALPNKKTMTFTKHSEDFDLNVFHADLERLNDQLEHFGSQNLTVVKIGLSEALKDRDADTFEALKVHFVLDHSGVFSIDAVEAVFNTSNAPAGDEGEGMLGGMLNSLWGSDDTVDEAKEAEVEEREDVKPTEEAGSDKKAEGSDAEEPTSGETDDDTKGTDNKSDDEKAGEQTKAAEESEGEKKSKQKKQRKKEKKDKKADPIVITAVTFEDGAQTTLQALPKDSFTKAAANLAAIKAAEQERLDRASAMTELEGYAVDMRMNLMEEPYEVVTAEEERSLIRDKSNEVSDWLYDDGMDATTREYRDKLKELKELMKPVVYRKTQREELPIAVRDLRNVFNLTKTFLNSSRTLESWRAKEDLDALELACNNTETWLNESLVLQDATLPHLEPVLTTVNITDKKKALSMILGKEFRRVAPPPPKPKKKSKKNTTKITNDTAEGEDETVMETEGDAEEAHGAEKGSNGNEDNVVEDIDAEGAHGAEKGSNDNEDNVVEDIDAEEAHGAEKGSNDNEDNVVEDIDAEEGGDTDNEQAEEVKEEL